MINPQKQLALQDRLVDELNANLRGQAEANPIIGNTHVYFMDVSTFRRDLPATPRFWSTFGRYDGDSYRGPGILLFWAKRILRLNIRMETPRFEFATLIRHAIDRMARVLNLADSLWTFTSNVFLCSYFMQSSLISLES